MKNFLFAIALLMSVFASSQNIGNITGIVMDVEENNAPLILAKITIKETGAETLSDENGYFLFKNLKEGNYTLVSSFVGYETKEFKTKITPNKTNNITLQLSPSSLLLEDLVLVMASADKKETATLSNN